MPDALAAMLPGFVPAPHALVLITGLLELAIAVALLIRRSRRMAGWAAVLRSAAHENLPGG